jgi:hypothetical protein
MDDHERRERHMFPRYDDMHEFLVLVNNQYRKIARVGNRGFRGMYQSLNAGTLIFTDCTHPSQQLICDEAKIQAWRQL